MRLLFARLRTSLVRLLAPAPSHRRRSRTPGLERLEERAVPASLVSQIGPGGTGPLTAHGDAYTLAGGVDGDSPYAVKWSQPGGRGAPVTITYSYSNLLNGGLGGGLPAATIKAAIQEALVRWASVAPLRFVEVPDAGPAPSTADYDAAGKPMIRFGYRPVDGAYNVLAYGYYPGYTGLAGDIQFDSTETWSVNPSQGIDLTEVATHEIGHALGLAHSQVSPAIMDAIYGGYYHGPGTSFLYGDDVAAIRALYGAGSGAVIPLAPPTFSVAGSTLYVRGTAGNDTFVFDGARGRVTLNGQTYAGSLSGVRAVIFDGLDGYDRAIVTGTGQAETFTLRPGSMTMAGAAVNLSVYRTEIIDATAGAGDQVTIVGSGGNDLFVGHQTAAWLTTGYYAMIARGFASVNVLGGGGADAAYLYGTAGTDTLTGGPGSARFAGAGFAHTVHGFTTVVAVGNGGSDQATLTDSPGDDVFASRPGFAAIQGSRGSFLIAAHNFTRVTATASSGRDVAWLYGSAGGDDLIGTATYTALEAAGTRNEVHNFELANAFGQGGADTAYLYGSAGDDRFLGQGRAGALVYGGTAVQFVNFAQAVVYGTGGSVSRRQVTGLGFALDWAGTWAS
jgi:hypothetical protein